MQEYSRVLHNFVNINTSNTWNDIPWFSGLSKNFSSVALELQLSHVFVSNFVVLVFKAMQICASETQPFAGIGALVRNPG